MKRIVVFTIALLLLPAALESNPTVGTKEAKEALPASVPACAGKRTGRQEGSPTQLQELKTNTRELQISIDWLKWIVGLSLLALAGLITYLHSDTKQNIQKLEASTQRDMQKLDSRIDKMEANTRQDMQKLESGIQEIRSFLFQLVQNKHGLASDK